MSVETAPRTQETGTSADVEVFAPVSPENVEGPQEDTPRLLERAARRVAELSTAFGDNIAARRTPTEVLDDTLGNLGDRATAVLDRGIEHVRSAETYGKQRLTAMGRTAKRGSVNVITFPARLADRGVDAARRGLEKIEERAQTAEARKQARADARQIKYGERRADSINAKIAKADAKQMRLGEKLASAKNKEIAKVRAKQMKVGEKLATAKNKEIAKNERRQEKADARQMKVGERLARAKNAEIRKAARKARNQERIAKAGETISKNAKNAKQIGQFVVTELQQDYHMNRHNAAVKKARNASERAQKHRSKIQN